MIDHLQLFLDAVYAGRWILVIIGFAALGSLYALALSDRSAAEDENAELAAENARLRAERDRAEAARRRLLLILSSGNHRRGVVALPARGEVSR